MTSGVMASVASTGTLRTPEGNERMPQTVHPIRARAGAAGMETVHHEQPWLAQCR